MAADEMAEPQRVIDIMAQPATPRVPGEPVADGTSVCATPKQRVGDPFQAFLSILLAMLRGHVEVPKYEDECRTLLGTYSYKLFTLDKLIPRFIKETNSLIQSEQWQTMKKGAAKVENGSSAPSELKAQMLELFWHNCFELDYTISAHSMRISAVPLKEDDNIPALAVVSDILAASQDADEKDFGMEDNEDSEEKTKTGTETTHEQGSEGPGGEDFHYDDDNEDDDENAAKALTERHQKNQVMQGAEDTNDQPDDKWRASLLSAQAEAMEEEDDDE